MYLQIYFCDKIRDMTLKDLGFGKKWRYEIWINDLNLFFERFEF